MPSPIVDRYGKPFAFEPTYRSAGRGPRFAGYQAAGLGPNAALIPSQPILVARSRKLLANDPIIWKGLNARVANAVGTGVIPESLASTGDKARDEALRAEIGELWGDWVDDADADGVTNFYGLQAIAIREMFAGGECFIRLRDRRMEDGLAVPLQVQLLPGEMVPSWKTEQLGNGNTIYAGIERNGIGQRVAYWMYRTHPCDGAPNQSADLVRVPAEQVLHLYDVEAAGQLRGIPALSRILLTAHEMGLFNEATLNRHATAAMFAVFLTSETGEEYLTDDERRSQAEARDKGDITLTPGMGMLLPPGFKVNTATPPDIGAGYHEFWKAMHLVEAAGVGVPYEMLTGDLSDVNYSSIRAGIVEFRRHTTMLIHNTLGPVLRKIYRAVLTAAVRTGQLSVDLAAFTRQSRKYLRAEWTPQGFDWVDPLKEVLAWERMLAIGLDSRRAAHRELGYNPRQKLAEIAAEREEARQLGLVFETDADAAFAATEPATAEDASRRRQQREAARARLEQMALWDDKALRRAA